MEQIRQAFKFVFATKSRTIITIISIAIGVASVIVVNSISLTGQNELNYELDGMGLNGILLSSDSEYNIFDKNDIDKILTINGVEKAIPISIEATEYMIFNNKTSGFLFKVASDKNQVIRIALKYGRDFTDEEIYSGGNVCQVDKELAKTLYKRENIVGKKIKLAQNGNFEDFLIIGVVEKESKLISNIFGNYIPSFIYVPQDSTDKYKSISIEINKNYKYNSISNKLKSMLNEDKPNTISIKAENLSKQRDELSNIMRIISTILTVIGGISLSVAGLGIMTIMLVSVSERKNEIGIKKSIGATNGRIMCDFLIEAIIITLIGSVAGSIATITLMELIKIFFPYNIIISYNSIIYLIVVAVIIGVIFGVYPSFKASALRPVEALKRE